MSVTRRQKEVVDFISNFVERNGYSPSFDEIARRGLNLKSLATVHKHITNLQKKGLLERAHNRSPFDRHLAGTPARPSAGAASVDWKNRSGPSGGGRGECGDHLFERHCREQGGVCA